jgi:hypothetical protein
MGEIDQGLKEKLDLEKQKIELERERIKIEQENFKQQQGLEKRKTIITALGIVIPILIALLIINNNLQIQNKNAENEHLLAEEVAKTNFQLKAAEIVMNSRSVNETKNRAEVLTALFPQYLDPDFSTSLNRFHLENDTYSNGWVLVHLPLNGNASLSKEEENFALVSGAVYAVSHSPASKVSIKQ